MPAGINICQIRGCGKQTDLKRIPRGRIDNTRRLRWLRHCEQGTENLKAPVICMHHFSYTQYFHVDGKKVLKSCAVPDINLPRFPSDQASQERWKALIGATVVTPSSGVGLNHFRGNAIFNKKRTRLKNGAVASLQVTEVATSIDAPGRRSDPEPVGVAEFGNYSRPSTSAAAAVHSEEENASWREKKWNKTALGARSAVMVRTETYRRLKVIQREMKYRSVAQTISLLAKRWPDAPVEPAEEMASCSPRTERSPTPVGAAPTPRRDMAETESLDGLDSESETEDDPDAAEDELEASDTSVMDDDTVLEGADPVDASPPRWDVRSAVVSEPQLRRLLTEMPAICQRCRHEVSPDTCRRCRSIVRRAWHSSEKDGDVDVFETVLAAAVTLSGCSMAGIQKLLTVANMGILSNSACQRIADKIVHPVVSRAEQTTVNGNKVASRRPRGLVAAEEMLEYVVTHQEGSREVNRLIHVADKRELLHVSKLAFGVTGNYALEVFNDKYSLYIRLDDMAEAPDEGRLLLVEVPSSSRRPVTPASTWDTDPDVALTPSACAAEDQAASAPSPEVDPLLLPTRKSERADSNLHQPEDGTRELDVSTPPRCVLDVNLLPWSTREQLLAGEPLRCPELRKIYQAVYDTYRLENNHSYPADYLEMAHNLMRSFPQLQRCLGMSEALSVETVVTKLRTKFRNARKAKPACRSMLPAQKSVPLVDGLPNYAPAAAVDSSLETERKLNMLRFETDMPVEERVLLLTETLPARRRVILGRGEKRVPMAELQKLFPFIFGESQLWREMSLLAGEPLRDTYAARLGAALDRLSAECGCPRELAAETLLRVLNEEETVVTEAPFQGPAVVRGGGGWSVTIDSTEVASCTTLDEALLCLAIARFVFNEPVSKTMKSVMWLLTRFVMELSSEARPSPEAG